MRVSALGLVEMTRKRTRESLEHLLCKACPACAGRGFVKSVESICHDIYREMLRQCRQFDVEQLLILAHPEVIERLLDEEAPALAEIELQLGRPNHSPRPSAEHAASHQGRLAPGAGCGHREPRSFSG